MVGDNAEHLPLTIPHTVAGDVNPVAADTALGHYLSGHVKEVTDAKWPCCLAMRLWHRASR